MDDPNSGQLLQDALDNAAKLLASICQQSDELTSNPGRLSASQLEEGKKLLDNAARAAQHNIDVLQRLRVKSKLPDEE